MSTSTIYLTSRFILLVILAAIISCDSLTEKDSIIPEKQVTFIQSDYYVLPYSSIIIDLKAVIKESFSDVTLSISEHPQKGTLSYVDTSLLKYRPRKDFTAGQDQFVLSAMSDGKILAKSTLRITMKETREEFPCTLIAVEDKIHIGPGASVSIPILENDRLCGIEKSNLHISIHKQPKRGQAIVDGESIIYIPGPEIKGHDEFIYKLTSSPDENVFGIISISRWKVHSISAPGGIVTKMVFVDENTGYLSGNSIYKTTDGGEHWTEVFNPENINYASFGDINFLDAEEGFAVYTTCEWGLTCEKGLAITKDGGVSWNLTSIPFPSSIELSSVFFTSSTTGFIGGTFENFMTQFLKTEDGGETWKQVLANQSEWPGPSSAIKFADSNTGYALSDGRMIFITQDVGESWKIFASYEHIPSMALITKDTFFASATILGSYTHPTSLVRFERASIFKEVANFPCKIWQLEFSPSGNVGFAVGIRDPDNQVEPQSRTLSINMSIDKGESWTEEYIDEDIDILSSYDFPAAMAVPSENVVYILYANNIIKYSNK